MATELWERIQFARKQAKMTQAQVASRLGISREAVSLWESNRPNRTSPSRDNLREFAAITDAPLNWLNDDSAELSPWSVAESAVKQIARLATDSPYLRVDQFDAEGDMGDGRENQDYPEVIRSVEYTEAFIRSLVGFIPAPGRLKLFTGRGDSMIPVIHPGEVVLVDTGIQSFEGDGIYLINTGRGQQIKALQDRGDAVYVVSANQLYPSFPFPHDGHVGGKLYVKNKIERFN